MQDHGIVVRDTKDQFTMENVPSNSAGESPHTAQGLLEGADTCINRIDDHLADTGSSASPSPTSTKLPKEQDLPESISSNFENIPLNVAAKVGDNLSYNDAKIPDESNHLVLQLSGETAENVTEAISTDSDQDVGAKKTADEADACVRTASIASDCQNGAYSATSEDCWKPIDQPTAEQGTGDTSELQTAYICENKNGRDQPLVSEKLKQERNCSEKPPTLSDDSRLVKIPLPTGSMNIMQTNAQFLNKSRNFLNFITEKSTNIMEKTLLPQHLALRYNSILKMSEATPTEKKNLQEPSIVHQSSSTLPSNSQADVNSESRTIAENPSNIAAACNEEKENFAEVISTESSQEREKHSVEGNSTNSVSSISLDELPVTKQENPLPLMNDCSNIPNKSFEINDLVSKPLEERDIEVTGLEKSAVEGTIDADPASSESSLGLLKHPVYLTLVRDYAKTREEKMKLEERVENLEARNRILEAQNSGELFNVQLEALEKTVERLTVELRAANTNQDELGREYAAANKERESMVMKYAVSEKQLIDTQRAREYAERKHKEIAKDYELLQGKLRQAQGERTRICSILDTKCRELTDSQKEVERLKEDVNVRDVKLKWTQTKLKTEMEGHKETQQKLDKATARINDMRDECEQIRRESQEMIRQFQHSEENKAVTLDQQLKEQQARLILERHVTEDKEISRQQLQKEVELLKNRQLALIEENNTLSLKIQDLEKNRLSYEGKLSELKTVADQRQKEIVDLSSKVSHLETLKLQLIHKEQCLMSNEAEVERLRQVNQELQADMACCRQREAHMLDFTQKLTDKNVRLQSEFTAIEARSAQLEQEQGPLRDSIVEFKAKIKALEESLTYEKNKRIEECEILARHLAEQTQTVQNLTQKLEESQGEIAVLKRKQQISVKEMSRELQQCRKRLERYESASPSNSLDPTSRAGSNNSLNAGETLNGTASDHSGNGDSTRQTAELDRQSLIDRILKMQKINVRRAEKLDFLEEHTRTLVSELQKKTKIIQNYILHENFDAMGSNERDRHKAELARYGGIMASVYSQRVSDDNMTLELSLEINQKLQAVLEDALLKNITLKDNIDTLGEEIARLTIKNQQLLQQKGK